MMAQVLITSDDGSILFDGTINVEHARDLAQLIQEQFMAKEWMDVPEEELGLETGEAIDQLRDDPGYQEVPKGFPVMQRRRLISAIGRLAETTKKIEVEEWEDGSCAKDSWRKAYPNKDQRK